MSIWSMVRASIISTSPARWVIRISAELILDCLNRTENAMTQEHAFKAAELCLIAQKQAIRVE